VPTAATVTERRAGRCKREHDRNQRNDAAPGLSADDVTRVVHSRLHTDIRRDTRGLNGGMDLLLA
jgi:hypothetical protein